MQRRSNLPIIGAVLLAIALIGATACTVPPPPAIQVVLVEGVGYSIAGNHGLALREPGVQELQNVQQTSCAVPGPGSTVDPTPNFEGCFIPWMQQGNVVLQAPDGTVNSGHTAIFRDTANGTKGQGMDLAIAIRTKPASTDQCVIASIPPGQPPVVSTLTCPGGAEPTDKLLNSGTDFTGDNAAVRGINLNDSGVVKLNAQLQYCGRATSYGVGTVGQPVPTATAACLAHQVSTMTVTPPEVKDTITMTFSANRQQAAQTIRDEAASARPWCAYWVNGVWKRC